MKPIVNSFIHTKTEIASVLAKSAFVFISSQEGSGFLTSHRLIIVEHPPGKLEEDYSGS